MKSADKYLVMILIGVIVLLAVAFRAVLLQPKPTYQPEDTPEGVANNYLFALQQGDYERAYGYLSPDMKHYPASVKAFTANIHSENWRFNFDDDRGPSLQVKSSQINKDRAAVTVQKTTFYAGGLLSSSEYRSTFKMTLVRDAKHNGAWKIESSDDYWAWCWDSQSGCK